MITCSRAGLHLVITPRGIEWASDERKATAFASLAAFQQCLAHGRLGRAGLRFVRWNR